MSHWDSNQAATAITFPEVNPRKQLKTTTLFAAAVQRRLGGTRDGREGTPLFSAREGQPERDHLLGVASQQDIADEYRVVPGLALDRREARELRELVGEWP